MILLQSQTKARSEHTALNPSTSLGGFVLVVEEWHNLLQHPVKHQQCSSDTAHCIYAVIRPVMWHSASCMLFTTCMQGCIQMTRDAAFKVTFSRVSCMASKALCEGTAARALMISSTNGLPEPNMRTSKSSRPAHSNDSDQADCASHVWTHALLKNSIFQIVEVYNYIYSIPLCES